jgi:5'-methylthioadenosine phosphorylase
MQGLVDIQEVRIDTPFGPTSDDMVVGTLDGVGVAFLSRHGMGHRILPMEVPYRANIWAMKSIGIERIIGINAVGSMREEMAETTTHRNGTYVAVEGPAFSTKAETKLYRSWDASIIGMTALPEARLAREAEICYATLAFVTDYDTWHEEHEPVTAEVIIRMIIQTVEIARSVIRGVLRDLPTERSCTCGDALAKALITGAENVPDEVKRELAPIIGRYMPAGVNA